MKALEQDGRWILLTCGHVVPDIRPLPSQTGYRCGACRHEWGWRNGSNAPRFQTLAEYYAAPNRMIAECSWPDPSTVNFELPDPVQPLQHESKQMRRLLWERKRLQDRLVAIEAEIDDPKSWDISVMDWSMRAFNVLCRSGIKTLGAVVELTPHTLGKLRNCGPNTIAEIEASLREVGLTLSGK